LRHKRNDQSGGFFVRCRKKIQDQLKFFVSLPIIKYGQIVFFLDEGVEIGRKQRSFNEYYCYPNSLLNGEKGVLLKGDGND